MLSKMAMMTRKNGRVIAATWLVAMGLVSTLSLAANAQFAEPLATYSNPLPPPIGDGPEPMPVTPGDQGSPLPPPSGVADQTGGNMFSQGTGHDRTTVYVFRRGAGGVLGASRGERMEQTIRPDQLSQEQIQKIQSILGINMLSGEQSVDVTASDSQIEQIQDVLAKYPQYDMVNSKKKITKDAGKNTTGWKSAREKESAYDFQGPIPTVRTFARYLVILGVVSATIWMAIAATSVLLGHRDGPSKVIGTAAGLMLLLCGYTIWKIVQMNTFKANPNIPAVSQNRPNDAQVSDAYINPTTVPTTPPGGRAQPERFGIPLVPLGGADAN